MLYILNNILQRLSEQDILIHIVHTYIIAIGKYIVKTYNIRVYLIIELYIHTYYQL